MRRGQVGEDSDLNARFALVDEHIRLENARDIDGIMATFCSDARYDDEPWSEHHTGLAGVRGYYETLLRALPDLRIDVQCRYGAADALAYEVTISGTHLGRWRGIPATGRRVKFPLVAIYTFAPDNRLAGERIYYDRAMVLRQLGLFREPDTLVGRIGTALAHPWTVTSAYARQLWAKGR